MAKLRKKIKIGNGCMTAILIALLFVVIYTVSWICTCGIIKLITMCFGLTFSWAIATGIWLVILLLKGIFNVTVKNESKPTRRY